MYQGLSIEKLREKYGDDFKRLSVRAKDQGEEMQDYNILEYCLTKSVSLSGDNEESFDENYVQSGDLVVISGKNLYDGKTIR